MIISTDEKKNPKFWQSLMIQAFRKQETDGNVINPIKVKYNKHHWDCVFKLSNQTRMPVTIFLFNI